MFIPDTGKPPKFEARKIHNKSTEPEMPLVIPDREYEIEQLPLYQEQLVTGTMSSEGNFGDDFAPSSQAKSKSVPSDDNFGDDFVISRKPKGKKSVPGKSLVRVYTYQVRDEMEHMGCWLYFCCIPQHLILPEWPLMLVTFMNLIVFFLDKSCSVLIM